jgi:hypothetical protein
MNTPNMCLQVFQSMSQTFSTKNNAKLVFRSSCSILLYHASEKKLHNKRILSMSLDPKLCLWMFRSILQTFGTEHCAKLLFRNKHTESIPLGPKWCLEVFQSISQTFDMKKFPKLVFQAWMHYFGLPNFQKKFSYECTQSMLRSVSKHFANLRHEKQCKTCVSGVNALFQGSKLPKEVLLWSISKHFANHWPEKLCKTCVSVIVPHFVVPRFRKKLHNKCVLSH